MRYYENIDKLPRLVQRILDHNYETLGLFWRVTNEELTKGSTQAEAFTEAWKWVKDVYNKP